MKLTAHHPEPLLDAIEAQAHELTTRTSVALEAVGALVNQAAGFLATAAKATRATRTTDSGNCVTVHFASAADADEFLQLVRTLTPGAPTPPP